ncbi:MAG: hypothetical protein ACE5F1_07935 [Planctomycetota bacterium]
MERLLEFRTLATSWCRGRSASLRLPLLLYLGYVCVRCTFDNGYWSLIAPLNLGVHELGHFVFAPLGQFLAAAGGSILQCLVPLIGMGMFFKQQDYFAIAVALLWLSTNLFYVAWYMADARQMAIPLVTVGGGDATHDWNYLLSGLGLLRWDGVLSGIVSLLGTASMLVGLLGGAWLLWTMAARQER